MTVITIAAIVLLAIFAGLWAGTLGKIRRMKGKVRGSPIPLIRVDDLEPRFTLTPNGPPRSTEVVHIAGVSVEGGISDFESWILCNLAKTARRIFEFGTATGKTTYLLARNSPDAQVFTITLRPDQIGDAIHERGDDARLQGAAARESAFETFTYSGSPEAARITQLFGDSKAFDETPYADSMDLIFVDGAHTESYVRSDTEKALRMLRPGGWLLWHDYRGPHVPGTWRVLNELHDSLSLHHIRGTSLVAYRKYPT